MCLHLVEDQLGGSIGSDVQSLSLHASGVRLPVWQDTAPTRLLICLL